MEKINDINPELLKSLYWGNGYTLRQIDNISDCNYETIRNRMIEYGIPRRVRGGCNQVIIVEPELLESLYYGNSYSIHQIANIFSCYDDTIRDRMIEYGIPRRAVGTRSDMIDFTFNDKQKQIFEGCMLGDGGLRRQNDNYCYFRNTDIHKGYLIWLQKQLGVKDISRIYHSTYNMAYQFSTRVIPSLQDEYKKWYPNGNGIKNNYHHKVIPKDIALTPIKILFWYLGDGHYANDRKTVWFTNGLIFEDWLTLSKKIYKILSVDDGIYIHKSRKDKFGVQRYMLRLNKAVTKKFFDMVDNLGFDIPECYQYKFGRSCV